MEPKRRASRSYLPTVCCVAFLAAAPPFAQSPPAPLPSTLPLQLTGVMADDKAPARSVCFIRCLASSERRGALGIGDVACGVAEITEIRQDAVVVRNLAANRLELLVFPAQPKSVTPGQAAPPAAPAPVAQAAAKDPNRDVAPASMTVDVPKATLERYLSNLGELLQSALAVPHYAESPSGQKTMDGFTISRIKEGGAAEQVGLRDGDVVQEIDGQALDDMSTVMALFGRLPTMTQAKVRLLRAGQPVTIVISVK